MSSTAHRVLPWLLPLCPVACGDDSGPGEGESSTGGSASTGSDTSTGVTQSTLSGSQSMSQTESESDSEPSSGTTDEPSSSTFSTEGSSSGETDASTGTGSETDPGTGTGDPDTSGSTGALECDIQSVVNAAAVGKEEPFDCGFVTLADMVDVWEAAHDCALEHYEGQSAFTLVAQLMGIDSNIHIGYAGSVGEEYIASQFFSDDYGGAVTIWVTTPCNLAPVAACAVAVGELCLECVDPPPSEEVCQG